MRPPGIEPGSSGWKPEILTTILRARFFSYHTSPKFGTINMGNVMMIEVQN